MKHIIKNLTPFLLMVLGFFALQVNPIVAGVLILVGIVMLIERKWPEDWGNK